MTILYSITFFIFGITLGSFYNVVGSRLPRSLSIVTPPSHCEICNKKLKWYNLIPLLSYIFQDGKCSFCKTKISIKYFLYELITGLIFTISYLVFGFSYELVISLTFFSALIIVIISDIDYMIIPDEVIIITTICLLLEIFIFKGFNSLILSLLNGVISFLMMWGLKLFGDFVFKKESMGGGDIKLMGIIGIIFNPFSSVLIIFTSSVIALPYAIITMIIKKDNIVPYGPFLSLSAIILVLLKLQGTTFENLVQLIS